MTEIEKPLKISKLTDIVQEWYAKYVDDADQVFIFLLILAAKYMDIKPSLDLSCANVVSKLKGKTREDLRTAFTITKEFATEEEAKVREENKWCEERLEKN